LKLADKEELVRRLDRMEMAILPRVAIVGRPNVGKSTLFNRFVGKRKAITDPTPGVTRDPIFHRTEIEGRACMLIDTGGLTESREYLDTLITSQSLSTIEQADILVFVLDVTEVTPEDEEFLGRLRQMSDRIVLAVNKVDNEQRAQMVYEFYSLGFDTIFPISATHGEGGRRTGGGVDPPHRAGRAQAYSGTETEQHGNRGVEENRLRDTRGRYCRNSG
jgi:small GTP-binding protein